MAATGAVPVAWPNPEKTGAAGAAATTGAATLDFPMRLEPPPIGPVAWPKPEKIGSAGLAAATGAAAATSPVTCPKPENPGTPVVAAAAAAGGGTSTAATGLYPPRKCPFKLVVDYRRRRGR